MPDYLQKFSLQKMPFSTSSSNKDSRQESQKHQCFVDAKSPTNLTIDSLTIQSLRVNDHISANNSGKSHNSKDQREFFTVNSKITVEDQQFKMLKVSTNGQFIVNFKNQGQQVLKTNCHFAICHKMAKKTNITVDNPNITFPTTKNFLHQNNIGSKQKQTQQKLEKWDRLYIVVFQLMFQKLNTSEVLYLHCSKMLPENQGQSMNQHIRENKNSKDQNNTQISLTKILQKWFDPTTNTLSLTKDQNHEPNSDQIHKFRFKDYQDFLTIKFFVIQRLENYLLSDLNKKASQTSRQVSNNQKYNLLNSFESSLRQDRIFEQKIEGKITTQGKYLKEDMILNQKLQQKMTTQGQYFTPDKILNQALKETFTQNNTQKHRQKNKPVILLVNCHLQEQSRALSLQKHQSAHIILQPVELSSKEQTQNKMKPLALNTQNPSQVNNYKTFWSIHSHQTHQSRNEQKNTKVQNQRQKGSSSQSFSINLNLGKLYEDQYREEKLEDLNRVSSRLCDFISIEKKNLIYSQDKIHEMEEQKAADQEKQNTPIKQKTNKSQTHQKQSNNHQQQCLTQKKYKDVSNQSMQDVSNQSMQDVSNQSMQDVSNQSMQDVSNQSMQDVSNQSMQDVSNQSMQDVSNQSMQGQFIRSKSYKVQKMIDKQGTKQICTKGNTQTEQKFKIKGQAKKKEAYESQITTACKLQTRFQPIFQSGLKESSESLTNSQMVYLKNHPMCMDEQIKPRRLIFQMDDEDKQNQLLASEAQQSEVLEILKMEEQPVQQKGYQSDGQKQKNPNLDIQVRQKQTNIREHLLKEYRNQERILENNQLDNNNKKQIQSHTQLLDYVTKTKHIHGNLTGKSRRNHQSTQLLIRTTYSLDMDHTEQTLYIRVLKQQIIPSNDRVNPHCSQLQAKLLLYNPIILCSDSHPHSKDQLYRNTQFINHLRCINSIEVNQNSQDQILLYSTLQQSSPIVLKFNLSRQKFTDKYRIPSIYGKCSDKGTNLPLKQVKYQYKDSNTSFFTLNDKEICLFNTLSSKNNKNCRVLNKIFTYKHVFSLDNIQSLNYNLIFNCLEVHQNGSQLIVGTNTNHVKVFDITKGEFTKQRNQNFLKKGKENTKHKKANHSLKYRFLEERQVSNCNLPKSKKISKLTNMHKKNSHSKINYQMYFLNALNSFDLSREENILQTAGSLFNHKKLKQMPQNPKILNKLKQNKIQQLQILYKDSQADAKYQKASQIYCHKDGEHYTIECSQLNEQQQELNCFQHKIKLDNRSFIRKYTKRPFQSNMNHKYTEKQAQTMHELSNTHLPTQILQFGNKSTSLLN